MKKSKKIFFKHTISNLINVFIGALVGGYLYIGLIMTTFVLLGKQKNLISAVKTDTNLFVNAFSLKQLLYAGFSLYIVCIIFMFLIELFKASKSKISIQMIFLKVIKRLHLKVDEKYIYRTFEIINKLLDRLFDLLFNSNKKASA